MTPSYVVYYSPDDDERDGSGWNVIDSDGAVAARFPTVKAAQSWCAKIGCFYTILNRTWRSA